MLVLACDMTAPQDKTHTKTRGPYVESKLARFKHLEVNFNGRSIRKKLLAINSRSYRHQAANGIKNDAERVLECMGVYSDDP